MRSSSPLAVRCGLLGVFAVLAVGLVAPTVSGQFRPGMPGSPNIPRPPVFPPLPTPGGIGRPGIGIPENIYYCGRCRTEVGRGRSQPISVVCPGCNTRYLGGRSVETGGIGGPVNPFPGGLPGMPGAPPGVPATAPPQPFDPPAMPQPFNPNPVGGGPALPTVLDVSSLPSDGPAPPVAVEEPTPTPSPTPSATAPAAVAIPKSSNRSLLIIGGIVLGLLVVLGMVLGVMYVKANAKQTRPVRRRVRRDD